MFTPIDGWFPAQTFSNKESVSMTSSCPPDWFAKGVESVMNNDKNGKGAEVESADRMLSNQRSQYNPSKGLPMVKTGSIWICAKDTRNMSKSGKYLVWENYVTLSLNILNMHWLDTNRQVNMMADTYALTHTCHGHQQMQHPDCKTFSSSCLNLSTNKKEKKKPNDWWPTYRPLWQINCYMHVV